MCVTVVQRSSMFLKHADKPGSCSGDTVFCFFVPFFLLFGLFLLTKFFLLAFFFCSLTADPAGHALGLIYILNLSLEFYFGKKILVPLYIVLIINIITLKSPLGQLPPKIIKRNLLLVFGISLQNYRCIPNAVLKWGKATRFKAYSLS